MPNYKRYKTKYLGVSYIFSSNKEKIFYIRYRKNGKQIEERAGRQYIDSMTSAKASYIRLQKIRGIELSNNEKRQKSVRKLDNIWTIDKLWKYYKENRPDIKGIKIDEYRYEKHLKQSLGTFEPKSITHSDIDKLKKHLLKISKPGSTKKVLGLLQRVINYGVKKQLTEGLSFKIEMPKVNDEKTEDLTPEQLKKLYQAIESDLNVQAKAIMKMVLCTGMRRGEMFKLRWEDIDFNRGFISIRNPKGRIDQKIPLNEPCRKLLLNHPKISEFVFPSQNGNQRTDIRNPVNRIKKRAGLPKDFRPLHGLRHVYASMLASSGKVDLYTL